MSAAEEFLAEAFRAYGLGIEEHEHYFDVACEKAQISVAARPTYCDRGRFLVHAETVDPAVLSIDWADGFPRYYFGVGAAASELIAWMAARHLLPEEARR